jgi:hypothetical protein
MAAYTNLCVKRILFTFPCSVVSQHTCAKRNSDSRHVPYLVAMFIKTKILINIVNCLTKIACVTCVVYIWRLNYVSVRINLLLIEHLMYHGSLLQQSLNSFPHTSTRSQDNKFHLNRPKVRARIQPSLV